MLDYKVASNVMVFGLLAKGYKAGGYNSTEVGSEFENEDVWNFETGIKSVFPDSMIPECLKAFYEDLQQQAGDRAGQRRRRFRYSTVRDRYQ